MSIGFPREEWGWLREVGVEFRDESGDWKPVTGLEISPDLPDGTTKYLQPGLVSYLMQFEPVATDAIRLIGMSGGDPVDAPPTFGSTLTELSVH